MVAPESVQTAAPKAPGRSPGVPSAPPSAPGRGHARRWKSAARRAVLILAILGLAVYAFYRHQDSQVAEVRTSQVVAGPLVLDWSAAGYVEARTAQISSPVAARIVSLLVQEGEPVRARQVVARLSTAKEQSGTAVQREAMRAAAADADAARTSLREADRVTGDRVTQAEAGVRMASARLERSQATLRREQRVAEAERAAARAQVDAASQQLLELQNGPRPQELIQAEAQVADAVAARDRAAIERRRQLRLFREGAVARKALDDATEALSRTEAQVRRTQAVLDLLRAGTRPEQIAAARARVESARQQVTVAEANLAGVEALEREVGEQTAAVAQARAALAEALSARERLATLRAQVRAAERRVRQAAAGVRQSEAELDERTLTAPFAGRVGRRWTDPGDLAVPGQPLLSIVEERDVWVEAEADEQDLAPIHAGQRVSVTSPAYPGSVFPGRVTRIGAEAIPQMEQTRTSARIVRVRVSLERTASSNRRLRPGMEVDVAGRATLSERAVLVPNEAIRVDSAGAHVFLPEGGRLVKRRITPGHPSGRVTEVREGLRPGETVVLALPENVGEGSRVRARSTAP